MEHERDTTHVLDALRQVYGESAWAARRSDGRCACGDGLGAYGIAATWDAALYALCHSRMRCAGDRLALPRDSRVAREVEEWLRGLLGARRGW